MSIESAKKFIERIKTDEDFKKKITECKDGEARKSLIVNEGYDFTADDFKEVTHRVSDDELDNISGGDVSDSITQLVYSSTFIPFDSSF